MAQIRLQKIDNSLLPLYSCLEDNDYCYFLGEYASGQGFEYSQMNQEINNFKKPVDRKKRPEWRYKEDAISKIAFWMASVNCWDKLKIATWIPIPPSKTTLNMIIVYGGC